MSKIAQMLESLVNDDQAKAEELFHEYVVEKSREIYEGLIESELDLEEGDDQTDDFMKDVEVSDEEGEGEEGEEMGPEEEGEEEGEEDEGDEDEPATKGDINSLADAVRQLEAELSQMMGNDDGMGGDDMGGMGKAEELQIADLDSMDQGFGDLETVREYVEKVGAGHGAEKKGSGESNVNAKSVVAGKNDMGGTAANIVGGGEGSEAGTKGGLLDPSTKDLTSGNVNVPGSKTATKLSPVTKGHGAEKKGAGEEGGTVKTSLFRK